MEFLSDLAGGLTGALGGSVIGGIGAMFTKWWDGRMQLKKMELQIERDKMLNEHELLVMESEQKSAVQKMEYAALSDSIESDKATYTTNKESGWLVMVDVVRGLIRPVLTVTLLVYSIFLAVYLTRHYDVEFSNTQVFDMVYMIVNNLVVCSGVALTWWFGSRQASIPTMGGNK